MPVKTGWTDGLGVGMMHEVNEEEGWTGMNSRELTAKNCADHSAQRNIMGSIHWPKEYVVCQWDTHGCPQNPLMKIIVFPSRQFRVYRGLRKNHQATAPLRLNFGFHSCSKTSEIRLQLLEPEYSSWLIRKRGVQLPGFGDCYGKLRNSLEFAHQTYPLVI